MTTTEPTWFKSSYSGTEGDNCVEVAITEQAVSVRDSKDAERPHLVFGRGEWGRFVEYAARG
ncbi:DUF397 domain-containing protein [Streptomyces varsoviensis]|uniref:DUF397 domain-containing protein n=1 Tax=Streptomyces varsoviensis TaxID=67373 RepID=UPI0033E3E5F4